MKKSMRFYITGSIQPVFFNRFIKDNADKLGIKGYVRRKEDGRVEIFIEGSVDAMAKMEPLCRRGPQHSMIKNIEEKPERYQGFSDFKIMDF